MGDAIVALVANVIVDCAIVIATVVAIVLPLCFAWL